MSTSIKPLCSSHFFSTSSGEKKFFRIREKSGQPAIDSIRTSKMGSNLKAYKIISDLFGIELRKISALCNAASPEDLRHNEAKQLKANIQVLNDRINKINKRLPSFWKIKRIDLEIEEPAKTKRKGRKDRADGAAAPGSRKKKGVSLGETPLAAKASGETPDASESSDGSAPKPVLGKAEPKEAPNNSVKPPAERLTPQRRLAEERRRELSKTRTNRTRRMEEKKYTKEMLLSFYQNKGADVKGRTLEMIWGFPLKKKESAHDYIQWLFPLFEKSRFNRDAPLLTNDLLDELKQDPIVMQNFQQSFAVMLEFYGLEYAEDAATIRMADAFDSRSKDWLNPGNHNHSRISRILKCLTHLEMHDEAQTFYDVLVEINKKYPKKISPSSMKHWEKAITQA